MYSYSHPFRSSLSLLTSNPTSYTFNPSLAHSLYLQATNIKHLEPLNEMCHRIYVGLKEAFQTYKPFPFHDNEEARAIALVSNTPINQYAILSLLAAVIYLECDLDGGRAGVLGTHPVRCVRLQAYCF